MCTISSSILGQLLFNIIRSSMDGPLLHWQKKGYGKVVYERLLKGTKIPGKASAILSWTVLPDTPQPNNITPTHPTITNNGNPKQLFCFDFLFFGFCASKSVYLKKRKWGIQSNFSQGNLIKKKKSSSRKWKNATFIITFIILLLSFFESISEIVLSICIYVYSTNKILQVCFSVKIRERRKRTWERVNFYPLLKLEGITKYLLHQQRTLLTHSILLTSPLYCVQRA